METISAKYHRPVPSPNATPLKRRQHAGRTAATSRINPDAGRVDMNRRSIRGFRALNPVGTTGSIHDCAATLPLLPASSPMTDDPANAYAATPAAAVAGSSEPIPANALSSKGLALGLAIAALLGWVINSYSPFRFTIPEDLMQVNLSSPPEEKKRFEDKELEVYAENGLVHFGVLGLAFGLVPLMTSRALGVGRSAALGGLAGLAAGVIAFGAGVWLRYQFDSETPIPVLGSIAGTMLADILVFSLLGVILSLPLVIAFSMSGIPEVKHKAAALPLGGLLAGLVYPIAASFLFPTESTKDIPIAHAGMLATWLVILALFLYLIFSLAGEKKPR